MADEVKTTWVRPPGREWCAHRLGSDGRTVCRGGKFKVDGDWVEVEFESLPEDRLCKLCLSTTPTSRRVIANQGRRAASLSEPPREVFDTGGRKLW